MYRFASLYAMGQMLNRTPVYVPYDMTIARMESELAKTFPNFYKRIYFLVK